MSIEIKAIRTLVYIITVSQSQMIRFFHEVYLLNLPHATRAVADSFTKSTPCQCY